MRNSLALLLAIAGLYFISQNSNDTYTPPINPGGNDDDAPINPNQF